MRKLSIKLIQTSYIIYIDESFKAISQCLEKFADRKVCIITDDNVDSLIFRDFYNSIVKDVSDIYKYTLRSGDINKNLSNVNKIYKFLLRNNFRRSDLIISLGGGVVGDLAGFVAATFYRGLRFLQVPTTLLAQIDSSIGGKVGVNFGGIKNSIGAFYQPEFVFANVNVLKTLPNREFIAGMAEVIVHCVIKSKDLFEYIDENIEQIMKYDVKLLKFIVEENCKIKAHFVERDERDNGIRAFLNFGHTIGHAFESYFSFQVRHGECVSIGIVAAFKISERLGYVNAEVVTRVVKLLKKIGLPIHWRDVSESNMNFEKLFKIMHKDKKTENDSLLFIIPTEIGKVMKVEISDDNIIREVLM